jgi:NAD-dependent dihydropyrimidine dehydrogenase PreA subunit
MTFVIGEPCTDVMDRACMEECPADAIYEGERQLFIHPDECIDCGLCLQVCPNAAIQQAGPAMAPEWEPFEDAAVQVFDRLGPTDGGSERSDPLPDPPALAAVR